MCKSRTTEMIKYPPKQNKKQKRKKDEIKMTSLSVFKLDKKNPPKHS